MSRFPFWLQWLLAAMIAGLLTRGTYPRTLLLTGFIFGLAQWIVLYPVFRSRARLAHALWLPATAVSGLVGYLLIASAGVRVLGPALIALTSPYENIASHLIFLTFLWGIVGLGQWPLLRSRLPRAGRWVWISAAGGAAGALLDLALQAAGVDMHRSLLAGMLAGAGYGAVTGRSLSEGMSDPFPISVELLADYPHLIPAVGEMRWREWGRAPEPESLDWWVDVTAQEAGRDGLPVTWVAIDEHGQAVGAVGLGEFDIEERRDRSPWVLGMLVLASHRGRGIGGRLMQSLEAWAAQHGYSQIWVATGGQAVDFYRKCGWELVESFTRSSGERVSILTKALEPK